MRKRGHLNSKGEAVPIPWPAGAWARIQIKRPLEHSAERYIFKNEVNIGRATTLADDDFRIDLQQVSGIHCSIRRGPGDNRATVVHRSASNSTHIVKGDVITHKMLKNQACEAVICSGDFISLGSYDQPLSVLVRILPRQSLTLLPIIHSRPQILFSSAPAAILPSPADSELTDTQQNSFNFVPESSGSASAAASGGTSHARPAAADKDSPPVVEGGEDCVLSSRSRGRGSQGAKKRSWAKTAGGSAAAALQSGGLKSREEAPDSEDDGGPLIPAPTLPSLSQRAAGGPSEHLAPRLNQRQAAAERIDCADFESQLGVVQRSSAATSASSAAADEIDRLNRSVKQHVEKIRTLEMDLTKSNQEVAMLKLQNGSSEHQKILEQLKADNQSKSTQIERLKAHADTLAASTKDLHERLLSKDEEVRRLGRDVEAARSETLRAAAAAAAQANVSPERPTKEHELQMQLVSKESEIRRLNERLLSMSEQAAVTSRLLCDLQQEKDRVQELMSEVLELRRQLRQQQDEMKTQNVQASSRMLELQSQLQALRQRCDAADRDNNAKVVEAAAARSQCSEHESQMNALRRQLENSQLQLQIAQTNESNMKGQLDSERKLHLIDAQAAEELKQFAKKMYCILREGAMMLDKVPSSLGAACPPMKFDGSSNSASRDGSYSQ